MQKISKITSFVFIYTFVIGLLIFSAYTYLKPAIFKKVETKDYSQPKSLEYWSIRSIDTQIISKYWLNQSKKSIATQVSLLKDLNVNYVAVDTPYDRPKDLKAWVDEIHKQGLHVWFRSHWAGWEGDEGKPAIMTPQEYLDKTSEFIKKNPELFKKGDSFTVSVEAEQVGVGLGKRFLSWQEYKDFLLDEIDYANKAFKSINLYNQVYTNWLSANAWVVENAYDKDLVSKIGLIVIDHYPPQSQSIGIFDNPNNYSRLMSEDLDRIYAKWKTPILIGEWGYQIYQDTPQEIQAEMVEKVMGVIKAKRYIVGVNYWTHMGNHARIIDDNQGSNLKYRLAALKIKEIYENKENITVPPLK